ncbi:hypothetical protein C2R75_05595 [Helicobacter pylori]|uniref:Uncharacterized protein n=1 Tax=Helicobacter pylori GAM120Ai TaxID=1159029 RepID=A0AAV3IFZ4_HELPX|nr:hypothetical protein HMPREF1401_00747 [Helicobacter pylori GAM120Ai]EMH57623.1 hypothetical protein HMPREF1443_00925 [Helicobacter pylori HP250BFi]MUU20829.1 hypothetical protein [Helicobacter pylori]MUU32649.1 hypothetical protein [Helicobacter pylori]PUD40269.1 hypothetical protein C2R75_05595 [Helicobacter pylori]
MKAFASKFDQNAKPNLGCVLILKRSLDLRGVLKRLSKTPKPPLQSKWIEILKTKPLYAWFLKWKQPP